MLLLESLTKALDSLDFACDDLQDAHANADAVSELIISVLHEQAVSLRDATQRLVTGLEVRNASEQ